MQNKKNSVGTLLIMCPCYNEKEVIKDSAGKLRSILNDLILDNKISPNSRIVFIDDGSKDSTWDIIESLHSEDYKYGGIKLSRNFGQQSALMAAYNYAAENSDLCITLDVDLQDDISILPKMVECYLNGYDIVTTKRKTRNKDSFLKKNTAKCFYKLISLLGTEMKPEQPEYRLLSKKALRELKKFNEINPYPRDLVPRLGFNTTTIEFDRQERTAGTTKYNYPKLIKLAITSIVRSCNTPLLFPIIPGIIAFVGIFINIKRDIYWWLLFINMTILGYYIADLKDQAHHRPVYIIERTI